MLRIFRSRRNTFGRGLLFKQARVSSLLSSVSSLSVVFDDGITWERFMIFSRYGNLLWLWALKAYFWANLAHVDRPDQPNHYFWMYEVAATVFRPAKAEIFDLRFSLNLKWLQRFFGLPDQPSKTDRPASSLPAGPFPAGPIPALI